MRKGSIKNNRINMEVHRELSQIIRDGIKDPRISPMTSVTDARVTADLKYCTVYISVLGGDQACESTMKGLKSAEGYIRRELAHRINLRNTPELTFVLDKSMEYGMHIDEVINNLKSSNPQKDDDDETENEPTPDDTQ